MGTSIDEIKSKARKEVTSPVTGIVYTIKKLDPYDFMRARIAPVLSPSDEAAGGKDESDQADKVSETEKLKVVMTHTQYLLEKGAFVFFGEESATPEGQIHISWIPEDAGWLSDQVLEFSGFDKESREKIEAVLKNVNGSETSMKSAEPSESSRANS